MSTYDVPGAKTANHDVLAMGCWAEHEDGSLIFVESVENLTVVFSLFDLAVTPPVEYRTTMPEDRFKQRFTWEPDHDKDDDDEQDDLPWTWHDKTPFPWDRVLSDYPAGRHVSAEEEMSAAARVGASLGARAEAVREREYAVPGSTGSGRSVMDRLRDAADAFLR